MALRHAAPGEPWDVRPLGSELAHSQTAALFKSRQLEVVRLVLPAGKVLPPHSVPGDITLQCLEGSLDFKTGTQTHRLEAGQVAFLEGGELHSVSAVQDCSALLTIVLSTEGEKR
jgi:quercetin dioxygenase-like cupin family protein